MAEGSLSSWSALKLIGIAGLSLGVNHLIHVLLNKKAKTDHRHKEDKPKPNIPSLHSFHSIQEVN